MKELTLIPIIIIILLYIFRHQFSSILDDLWSIISNKIKKINYDNNYAQLYGP